MPIIPRQIPIGTRFFRWETLTEVRRLPDKQGRYAQCRCDCGTTREVLSHDLITGKSVSCKCFNKEVNSRNRTIHGGNRVGQRERLYSIWKSMKTRCCNPNTHSYAHYGGRGIRVCDEWASAYVPFRDWALSAGYDSALEIDRRDNDGDYCPENCHWITRKANANNKQQSVYLTAFGETKTILDWSADPRCAVSYHTLHSRLRRGWAHARSISTASRGHHAARKHRLAPGSELA